MRCNHCKRLVSVWACTSAIALLSGSAAFAELPRHPVFQTLEAAREEIQPTPDEPPQALKFGWSVAIRDSVAFVGMPDAFERRGRVAIFTQTTSGWQRTGTLDPSPDNGFEIKFGQSLAFRDGYVMVGASDSVYVFKRGNGAWKLSQRLLRPAADPVGGDFAQALHFESGVLVVGSPNLSSDRRHGTTYVYERNAAGTFVLRSTLVPTDSHVGDSFGFDVSVAANVIVIGAPDLRSTGAAYVFRRGTNGAWVQRQRLAAADAAAGDGFGWSVAIDKSMVLIGAPNEDIEGVDGFPPTSDGHIAGGAVYGFVPASGAFLETFRLRPRPDENPDYVAFGWDVAMFNKRIVVGATKSSFFGVKQGYVHTYTRDGSNVTALGLASGFLEPESNSLGLANQWLLVGSPYSSGCNSSGACIGNASVVDLTKFAQ
ncbi:MAG TPA: hypothetical protein VJS12_19610 [Steroidobacteraceae bacterium]|nr:hypothetical protein [Steroidobacteraceae bacterium]